MNTPFIVKRSNPATIPDLSLITTTGGQSIPPRGRGRHVGSALRWHHPLATRTGPALGEGQQKATGRLDRVLGLFHAKDGLPRAPVRPCHKNSWIQRKEYLEWRKIFFRMFFFSFLPHLGKRGKESSITMLKSWTWRVADISSPSWWFQLLRYLIIRPQISPHAYEQAGPLPISASSSSTEPLCEKINRKLPYTNTDSGEEREKQNTPEFTVGLLLLWPHWGFSSGTSFC